MADVLVSGGCGFVGRNLVRRLIALHGAQRLWVVDDLSSGRNPADWLPERYACVDMQGCMRRYESDLDPTVILVEADIREFLGSRKAFEAVRGTGYALPETFSDVYHFAAIVGGRTKIDGDPICVAQDLAMDADFFAWAVRAKPGRVLYPSSSAAYPVDLQTIEHAVAIKEDDITFGGRLGQPDMTYG